MRFSSMINPLSIVGSDLLSDEKKMEMLSELFNPHFHMIAAIGIGLASASAALTGNISIALTAVVVTACCVLLRVVIWHCFHNRGSPARSRLWLHLFGLGSLCSAVGWAAAFFVLFQVSDMPTLLIATGVACAIVQGEATCGVAVPGAAIWSVTILLSGIVSAALITSNYIMISGSVIYLLFSICFITKIVRLRMVQIRAEAKTTALLREMTAKNLLLEVSNTLLADSALTDGLTGVSNRRAFDSHLIKAFKEAKSDGTPIALLLIDVDNFKAFNDTYGHQAGDTCLQEIADCLKQTVLPTGAVVARYGGEEFAVILSNCQPAAAASIAQKLRISVQMRDLSHLGQSPKRQTVSIGVATSTHPGVFRVEDLVSLADTSLYRAKGSGRNAVVEAGDEQKSSLSTLARDVGHQPA